MKFQVGCELDYDISSLTTIIFNIRAIENKYQQVLDSTLAITQDCQVEEYIHPHIESSYLRLTVPEGKLAISYQA